MRSLVLGGTGFLGGAIVDAAADAGHVVTILSRGETKRHLPAGTRVLQGDRHGPLDVLENERFDFIFDTCAFAPDAVKGLLRAAGPDIRRYVFVSSISAYGDFSTPGLSETEPVATADEADLEVARNVAPGSRADAIAYGPSYGPLKRACEIAAQQMLGEKAILLRSGLLVGAGDYTDRLTWWMRRIDEGGRIPAPAPRERAIQLIDARDAAEFAVHAAVSELSGVYNVTGRPMPLSALLEEAIRVSGSDAELVWVDERKLAEAGIQAWSELPLMVPAMPSFRYFMQVDTEKAHRNGLCHRPLPDTLERLLRWDRLNRERPLKCGLSREKELAALS
ncbi:NAD-dependent epimerase/dehydratase family protein [Sinorhizobium numidicum]|uniref:NAD-dependent epimerase/dehydratase family protein n=1 Tax=Sinorhizobium numidicum TaxID=680248 RepID=A0ABY8CMP7_9HYPH|nr:NAD-dependent epimerase/dehydratase family protein [Sinorhizobium numidicum]WEX73953.1 NAD-dependent epimerase/dehydratase family protein [Sinorhizobium numidicum]WEX79938.1 NAD-dependent epimerase/dehydratase family protein [Sinorhizobium numidicum]